MAEVDDALVKKVGVASSADLPDVCYRDLYNQGVHGRGGRRRGYRERHELTDPLA